MQDIVAIKTTAAYSMITKRVFILHGSCFCEKCIYNVHFQLNFQYI